MNSSLTKIFIIGLSAISVSCSNPMNAHHARRYGNYGFEAEQGGDLSLARQNYFRAYRNAQIGNLGPKAEAYTLYELARVMGYDGAFQESEKAFQEVLKLIDKAKGEADQLRAPALSEYARLLHDTRQHSKAVSIYAKALPELEKVNVLSIDPMGFALFLDDYKDSLVTAGFPKKAAKIGSRSATIKNSNIGKAPRVKMKRYKKA